MTNKTYGDITVIDSLALGSNGIKDAVDYTETKHHKTSGDPRPVHMVIIDYLQLLAQYWGRVWVSIP